MSPWLIYLWGISDGLRSAVGGVSMLLVVGGLFALFVAYTEGSGRPSWCRPVLICGAILGAVFTLIPDQKTIALMYVLPRVAESEAIQRDVPELYRLAVDALKDQLTDEIGGNDERR